MRFTRLRATLFILVVLATSAGADEGLISKEDIIYGKGGEMDLKLDLYRPADQKESHPGVIVIHGGAWRSGNKESMRFLAWQIARAGYVTATVQYRLCPEHRFPAQIEDVKCAVRWMRAHAKEHLMDAKSIGALGASAGGHLALMLGMMDAKDGLEGTGGHGGVSSKVQAVVNYFGPTNLTLRDWKPRHERLPIDLLGGKIDDIADLYKQASPSAYIQPGDAPVITFHGPEDPIVPHGQATFLHRLLKENHIPEHFESMEGTGHGWLGQRLVHTQKLAIGFLDKHLKSENAKRD